MQWIRGTIDEGGWKSSRSSSSEMPGVLKERTPTTSKTSFSGTSSSLYILTIQPTDSDDGRGKFRILSKFPLVTLIGGLVFVKGQGRLLDSPRSIISLSSSSSKGRFFPIDTGLEGCRPDKLFFSLKMYKI